MYGVKKGTFSRRKLHQAKQVVTCSYDPHQDTIRPVVIHGHRTTTNTTGPEKPKSIIGRSEEETRVRKQQHDKIEQLYLEHSWLTKRGKETNWLASREQLRMLKCWFNSLDADGSGDVGLDELCEPLVSTGLCASIAEVQALIETVDSSGDGEIDFDEFLAMMGDNSDSLDAGKKNPVIALFEELSSGKLGDASLSLTMLITNFRRKKLMDGNMSEDPVVRQEGSRVLHAVKQLKIDLLEGKDDVE